MGSGLAGIPGIRSTHTFIVMEKVKDELIYSVGVAGRL
jgi:hypothetical protein